MYKNCDQCSREYKGRGKIFCSNKCRGDFNNIKVKKICKECDKEFKIHSSRSQKGGGKFCSNKCRGKSQQGSESWNRGLKLSIEHRRKISESHKGKTTWNKGMRGEYYLYPNGRTMPWLIGKNNPNWKEGITPENERIRKTKEYKEWAYRVKERDDYICCDCGERGKKLHSDHIKPFSIYPELRFNLDNGQTLCIDCHREKTKIDFKIIKLKQYAHA